MTDDDNSGSAQGWIDDLTDPSDGDDDSGPTLFEENFRKMVEDGDLGDMAVSTLEGQVERIDDPEILSEAMDVDDREDAQDIYQNRVGEINEASIEEDGEGEEIEEDDGEEEVVEDGGSEDVNAVVDDLVGGDDDSDNSEDAEPVTDDADEEPESEEVEDESEPDDSSEATGEEEQDTDDDSSELPDVDVTKLAPDAISREAAASKDKQRTVLIWGPEGSGKSHVAHSAPSPICYIDTEGKADELAEKFDDKEIHYFVADDYKEAKSAMEQALDVLEAYLDAGVRGTLVVDSMTAMWEYAKVDYAKFAYQTDDLSEVKFQSELEGEKDWTKIKARHNEEFRERILESPYHVVFTSGQKEDYGEVFEGGAKKMIPDGEKWNRYAVKDVVRLRRDGSGKTVADLRKAAKTRYSFAGLLWPTFDSIYEAIDSICEAEQAESEIDVSNWEFSVVDGQPVGESPDGSDGKDEEDDDGN